MKQVTITINGTIEICEYCSRSLYGDYDDEEEAFWDNYYITNGWYEIDALYVNNNRDENLLNRKGKYVETSEYFHELFKEDGEHPLPVDMHFRETHDDNELDYVIELDDDEEFDIEKVQLIKSDGEIKYIPNFILAQKILYNGKEVEADERYADYSIDGDMDNEVTIEDFLQYDE